MLRAPTGASGNYTVDVKAYDGTNTPVTESFQVTVVADTSTVTANPWASQTPKAPTSITFKPSTGQGTSSVTSLNNSSGPDKLQFQAAGVTPGDQVTLYANGVAIGSVNAGSATPLVTTNGTTTLPDGTYTITATQTALNASAVDSGDSSLSETANVDSLMSQGIQLEVVTSLAVTSTPATTATTGRPYSYTVTTNAPTGDTITVTPGSALPAGNPAMTFDAATNTFSWTPTAAEAGTNQSFTYTVTDAAGNSTTLQTVNVAVAANPISITSTPATSIKFGQVYTYTVTTNAPTGDTVTVTPGTLPTYMQFDPTTQTFTWDPDSDQVGTTQTFSGTVTDTTTGATTTLGPVNVAVTAASGLSVRTLPATTMAIGSPVLVAFNSSESQTPNYSVTVTNSSDPTAAKDLTATLMPQTNTVLKIVTNLGEIDLQLLNNLTPNTVAHFVSLVNSDAYNNNATFYRIIENFVIQGGTGGTGSSIPLELNPDLRFTSSGLLAVANNGVDGNSSEFFITGPDDTSTTNTDFSDGFLDFRYTIFGKLISGDNIRQEIAAVPVTTNSSGEDSQPLNPPKILSMSVTTETNAGVLLLNALPGATGTYSVTVADGRGGSQTFTVNPTGTNPYDPPNPWFDPINGTDTITTPENTAVTFTPQGGSDVNAGSPAPQIDVQVFRPVPSVANAYVDNSYVPTIAGQFELEVGTATTSSITFDSTDLLTTASNIQTAIQALSGLSTATVTLVTPTTSNPTSFSFTVTFGSSQSPVTYDSSAANLEAEFANSATSAAATQTLTFTYNGPVPDATNPDITVTPNGSGGYTVTPATGFQGVQYLEVTAINPVTGTFELQVGSNTTGSIDFNSANLAATATDMENALDQLSGLSGTTVTAVTPLPTLSPTDFSFNFVFPGSEPLVSFVATSTPLPVTVKNSAVAATANQTLTFAETTPGTSWDANAGLSPLYTSYVPVFVGTQPAPPAAAKIASITVGGTAVSGNTFANNSTTATEFSFKITGATAGNEVLVYMDGGSSAIAEGAVASGATTITVTTNGTTKFTDGNHVFTVKQETPEATLYADFSIATSGQSAGDYTPGAEINPPSSSLSSAASAGVSLSVGLIVAPPTSIVQVGVPFTYVVQTNAPSSDKVTVTPVTLPAGMQFDGTATFTWTPSKAQLNTAPTFSITVSDADGNSLTIGPLNISVIEGPPPVQVPANSSSGGNVTVSFSGSQVKVYDNIGQAVLSNVTFNSSDVVTIVLPTGQANNVSVVLPGSAKAALPKEVLVQGASGATNNQVTVVGTGGTNSFTLARGKVTANGLATLFTAVQKITLNSGGGNSDYMLNSSSVPTSIVAAGGYNTMDFSHDTAGVTINLGLDNGQAQPIAPWSTTLAIYGAINKLIGSAYSDILTGGPAATTEIIAGGGNDKITGGSGDNILMGGGGNDTIIGGPGENLLIGGSGDSTIYANGKANIVFGGTTNYDSNDQALLNLLELGPRYMFTYSFRRALAEIARNPSLKSELLTFQPSSAHDAIFDSSNSWIAP